MEIDYLILQDILHIFNSHKLFWFVDWFIISETGYGLCLMMSWGCTSTLA